MRGTYYGYKQHSTACQRNLYAYFLLASAHVCMFRFLCPCGDGMMCTIRASPREIVYTCGLR